MLKIINAESSQEIAHVAELFNAHYEFNHREFSKELDLSTIPALADIQTEVQNLPGKYAPPRGRLKLAYLDDQAAGCFALRPIDAQTGEFKRLWVNPECRGYQIGWELTKGLIADAREIGYTKIILDTHQSFAHAQRIYHGLGFKDVPAPDDISEFIKSFVIFMELDLR